MDRDSERAKRATRLATRRWGQVRRNRKCRRWVTRPENGAALCAAHGLSPVNLRHRRGDAALAER